MLRDWIRALGFSITIALVMLHGARVWSQDATITDDPEEPLVELPETTVVGRPDPFPATPLGEQTVVTPTGNEVFRSEVGSSYTVITREQIERSRQTNVADVLRGTVGLDVVRQGGPGGLSSIFMRGANSQHTKVLLDGIPVNDPSNATRGFDFSSLAIDNIERIEVLRGPQSVLYGSDALGGVINIITRRGEGPLTVRASGQGGSFGTNRESVNVSGGDDYRYYSLTASHLHTDGISHARSGSELDRFRNATVGGRFGWNPSEQLNVDYVFRYNDADAAIDDFDFFTGLPVDNLTRRNLNRSFFNRVQLQSFMLEGGIEQKLGFSLVDYDRADTDPGFAPGQFLGQTRVADWQSNLLLTDDNTFTVGASYLQEEASSSQQSQVAQNLASIYVQDQIRLADRWFTTLGARWDDNSLVGDANTYRVTSIYQLLQLDAALHGSIGTGFRAPALAESLFAFGNPNLRPERSKGWDVGLRQWLLDERLELDATYFRNDFRDLIVFDFGTFSLQNVGQARATGVELSALYQLNDCTALNANYTRTDTLDLNTDRPLLRRPRDKAGLSVVRQVWCETATVNLNAWYVGERLDTGNRTLDEYVLVNLSGSYRLSSQWELFGRLDNLLDEQYEEVRGFNTPGFSGYAGLVWESR